MLARIGHVHQAREGNLSNKATLIAGHDAGGRTVARAPLLKVVDVTGGGLGGLDVLAGLGHFVSLVVVVGVTVSWNVTARQ